jgi:peptide/nickel transport system substrate-binding protein
MRRSTFARAPIGVRVAAAWLACGLLAAACGGDSDDEATSPSSRDQTTVPSSQTGAPASSAGPDVTDPARSTPAPPASTAGPGDPVTGGAVNLFDSGSVPVNFDPAVNPFARFGPGGGTQNMVTTSVYDSLIRIDYNTNEIIPRIATSVEPSADSTVWTITLRDGVEFSDGTPYDAAAVKYNWDRMTDPALASRCLSTVSSFASVETPDPLTLVVTLSEPSSGFPIHVRGCLSGVASPAALEEHGADYGNSPETTVGAGAFMVGEFVAGDHVTLVRNPGFWDAPRPYLDEIVVRAPTNQSQALDALLAGTVDMAVFQSGTLGTDYSRFLSATEIVRHDNGPLHGATAYAFNTNRPPLDDVRVRRALVMAFDPDDFNQKVSGGGLEMADTYLSEDSVFYNPDVRQPSNQLAEAQAFIDEYVAEHGPVEITLTNASSIATWNVAVQQQWNRLDGVTVEISADNDQSAGPKLATGDYQVAAFNLGNEIDPESLYGRYHSTSTANVLGFSDPHLDAWLEEYRAELDPARQKELVDQITGFLVMDQHWIMQTARVTAYTATTPRVTGEINWHSPGHIDYSTIWLTD